MLFFNGASGSLGRYFPPAAQAAERPAYAIRARIEDRDGFRNEVGSRLGSGGGEASLFLLAAKVSVPWCENHPEETRRTNVVDTGALAETFLELCRERGVRPKLVYASSAHLYARNDGVIHETDPLAPRSAYARSKREAEETLRGIAGRCGVDLRIARIFGLVAPAQPENYILPALLRRARALDLAGVPGLSNHRDYLDSRDVCRALIGLEAVEADRFARVCPDGFLNLASGEGITIRALLEKCLEAVHGPEAARTRAAGITEAPPRADDVPRIVASVDRYVSLFGTRPREIPIERTIRDSLST